MLIPYVLLIPKRKKSPVERGFFMVYSSHFLISAKLKSLVNFKIASIYKSIQMAFGTAKFFGASPVCIPSNHAAKAP